MVFVVGAGGPDPGAVIVSVGSLGLDMDGLSIVSDRLVVLALCKPRTATIRVVCGVPRIKSDGRVEVVYCIIVLLLARPDDATISIRDTIARIDPDSRVVVGDRVVEAMLLSPGQAAIDICRGEFGINPDGFRVVGDRLVVIPLSIPGQPAIVIRPNEFGIKLDGLREVGDRLVVFLLLGPFAAAAVECDSILGIDPNRLGIVGDRLIALVLVPPDGAAIDVGPDEVGIDPDGLGVVGDRLVVLLRLYPPIAATQVGPDESGIDLDGRRVIADRVAILILLDPNLPAIDVGPDEFGIDTDRLGIVGDRLIVFRFWRSRLRRAYETEANLGSIRMSSVKSAIALSNSRCLKKTSARAGSSILLQGKPDRLGKIGDRFLLFVFKVPDQAPFMVSRRILRIGADLLAVKLDRLVEKNELLQIDPTANVFEYEQLGLIANDFFHRADAEDLDPYVPEGCAVFGDDLLADPGGRRGAGFFVSGFLNERLAATNDESCQDASSDRCRGNRAESRGQLDHRRAPRRRSIGRRELRPGGQ